MVKKIKDNSCRASKKNQIKRCINRILSYYKMFTPGKKISVSGNCVYQYTHVHNGLQVLLCPVSTANSCGYMRVVHSGSKDETGVTKTGSSHFLEHMSFRIDNGNIWKMAKLGDEINASTNLDSTKFFIIHDPSQTEEAIKIDAHRFGNHRVPREKVAVEMQAVRNELLSTHTQAGPQMFAMTTATAIQEHPYHSQTIGTISDVENTKASELDNFRSNFYVPNNATLIFTGNFDPPTVLKHINTYFGEMPTGFNCNPVHSPEPVQNGLRVSELNIVAPCPMICIAFHQPSGATKESMVLKMIANLTWKNGEGRGKQLITNNILHDIGIYSPQQKDPYLWFFHATMARHNPNAQQKMLEVLQTFATVPADEYTFANMKMKITDEWNRETESVSDIMNALGAGVSIGNWTDVADRHNVLSSITRHDIMRVAATTFTKDNMTVTKVVPSKGLRQLPPTTLTVHPHQKAPEIHDLVVEENTKKSWSITKYGQTTAILHSPQAKYVRATISARFDPKYHDMASLLVKNLDEEGQQRLSDLHSNRTFRHDHEFVHLDMELPLSIGKLKQAASLIANTDWLQPNLNKEQIEVKKRQMISEMASLKTDQDYQIKSTFVRGLFANTSYHTPITQRIDLLQHLTPTHLKQFHQKWMLNGDNNYVTIVSPTLKIGQTLAEILPTSSQRPNATMMWKSLPRKARVKHIELKGYGSISLMIGQTVRIKGNHPASVALECAADILGGGMTGRLMRIVREEKGLGTYGIYSMIKSVNQRTDQIFVIEGSFSPDSFDDGVKCTKELLADFCKNGVTEEELQFAKTKMVGSRQIARDNLSKLQEACIEEIIKGNDPQIAFSQFKQSVGQLTVEQVNFAIRTYLDYKQMTEVSCGPKME
jgi:zinc protease